MKLNQDQARAMAKLIRHYSKLLYELSAAKSMIRNLSQLCQAPPENWQEALGLLGREASTKVPVEAFERVALQFEQGADEIDLTELLQKIPTDGLIN